MLVLKEDEGTEYAIAWKSLYTPFLHNIKRFGYKIQIQFKRTILLVEQNNYATKMVIACYFYGLDSLSKNPLNNFTLKNFTLNNCLFGTTNMV